MNQLRNHFLQVKTQGEYGNTWISWCLWCLCVNTQFASLLVILLGKHLRWWNVLDLGVFTNGVQVINDTLATFLETFLEHEPHPQEANATQKKPSQAAFRLQQHATVEFLQPLAGDKTLGKASHHHALDSNLCGAKSVRRWVLFQKHQDERRLQLKLTGPISNHQVGFCLRTLEKIIYLKRKKLRKAKNRKTPEAITNHQHPNSSVHVVLSPSFVLILTVHLSAWPKPSWQPRLFCFWLS